MVSLDVNIIRALLYNKYMSLKILDILIFFSSLAIIILFVITTLGAKSNNTTVKIRVVDDEYLYPLSTDRLLEFNGIIGNTTIEIKENSVRFISAPCKNKLCIHAGEINKTNQAVACLPNRVIITLEGGSNSIDGIAY